MTMNEMNGRRRSLSIPPVPVTVSSEMSRGAVKMRRSGTTTRAIESQDIILRTEGITKSFGALIVLRGIDIYFEARRGARPRG